MPENQKWENLFLNIFEQSPVGMALLGPEGEWLLVKKKFSELICYTPFELSFLNTTDILHPSDIQLNSRLLSQLFDIQKKYFSINQRVIKKNGDLFWANMTISVFKRNDGEPNGFLMVFEELEENPKEKADSKENTLFG
jgi:PAS domain S-box-containing protein